MDSQLLFEEQMLAKEQMVVYGHESLSTDSSCAPIVTILEAGYLLIITYTFYSTAGLMQCALHGIIKKLQLVQNVAIIMFKRLNVSP